MNEIEIENTSFPSVSEAKSEDSLSKLRRPDVSFGKVIISSVFTGYPAFLLGLEVWILNNKSPYIDLGGFKQNYI